MTKCCVCLRKRRFSTAAWLAVALQIAGGLLIGAQTATSQQPASALPALPAFEVVSIKPDKSSTGVLTFNNTADGFSASGFTAQMLVRAAYGYDDNLIAGGPNWFNTERYDLEAKVSGGDVPALGKLGPDQRNRMLQPLLAERFKLIVHQETQELPVYALVIAKGGSKLAQSKPKDSDSAASAPQMRMVARGEVRAQAFPISLLLQLLSRQVGRTVIDKTGLTGSYDFTLHWTPDLGRTSEGAGESSSPSDTSGPSLFTALQEQLGLRLEPTKGPVETLVIDHIERPDLN